MTFETISDLVKASDTRTHQCLDLSGNGKQVFVMKIPIDGLWHYFNELKPNGMFGARVYELVMTSEKEI